MGCIAEEALTIDVEGLGGCEDIGVCVCVCVPGPVPENAGRDCEFVAGPTRLPRIDG